jgi:hypothetical protein
VFKNVRIATFSLFLNDGCWFVCLFVRTYHFPGHIPARSPFRFRDSGKTISHKKKRTGERPPSHDDVQNFFVVDERNMMMKVFLPERILLPVRSEIYKNIIVECRKMHLLPGAPLWKSGWGRAAGFSRHGKTLPILDP